MNKLATLGIASLAIVGVVGVASVSASALNGVRDGSGIGQGAGYGRQSSLESRARVLNMSVADLEKALETKTMSQIAVEQGLDQATFQTKMEAAAKARWEARGLSSEEIDKRLADRKARQAANAEDHEFGSGEGTRFGGYGMNRNR
jgi:hypothetical protein